MKNDNYLTKKNQRNDKRTNITIIAVIAFCVGLLIFIEIVKKPGPGNFRGFL